MNERILVIGACGQIGTELTLRLREIHGADKVIASDIREGDECLMSSGVFEQFDASDASAMEDVCLHYQVKEVYLMAAMLSATAEKFPKKGWHLNMTTLFNVLDLAKDGKIDKVFWPSSIAVFGPSTPRESTPQSTIMEPTTVYGISKQAGERWCEYYHKKYGVDVRSIRYPGLISYTAQPGGGTTDYAVDIFFKAAKDEPFTCFLEKHTTLPMMYMEDAIRATLELMQTDKENVQVRSSYNIAGMSFNPQELAQAIKKHKPDFSVDYQPDFRQQIAESWPQSIDDSEARKHWGWRPAYDVDGTVKVMLENL